MAQEIVIDRMFSKWFLDDLGKNKTPDYFLDSCSNVRIKNWWITVRNGQQDAYDAGTANPIRWMNTNTAISSSKIYYCADSKLWSLDTTTVPMASTSIGSISTDNTVRFFNSGKNMVLLTWAGKPRHYDWTTLTQVTSTLDNNVNPQFWTTFAWASFINSQLDPNIMYVSRPITLASPAHAYDWKGSGSQTINLQSPLKAMIATMNALWVFTTENVQRLDRNNLDTTGGVASVYTVPFTKTYSPPANPDCVVTAGQSIFIQTENKKIATINYKGTVTEPQMAIISDIPWASIDWRMKREMHDDMSKNRAEYDPTRNLVKFHVRTRGSTVPDTVLIYDIQNDTFLVDDNKYTSCATKLNDTIYTGNALAHQIIIDEIGEDDLWDPISRSAETTDVVVWWLDKLKTFVWVSIGWQINSLSVINRKVLVDDTQVANLDLYGSTKTGIALQWIGGSSIWWEPIGSYSYGFIDDLVDFESIIDYSRLRHTGKKIKCIFSWGTVGEKFILDFYKVSLVPKVRSLRTDKYFWP